MVRSAELVNTVVSSEFGLNLTEVILLLWFVKSTTLRSIKLTIYRIPFIVPALNKIWVSFLLASKQVTIESGENAWQ